MRVMLLGVNGMLGATLFRYLGVDNALNVLGCMRNDPSQSSLGSLPLQPNVTLIGNLFGPEHEPFRQVATNFNPDVIVNCIGWRRQPRSAEDTVKMIVANSFMPHRLAEVAQGLGARLIHFSSDGVFSGRRGWYREDDIPDPIDAYGCSKWLGETHYPNCLIIRTSMIGHHSRDSNQLVDWVLGQKGTINGYQNAIFSGLPTIEIAAVVSKILLPRTDLSGTWHLAAKPISKFELLRVIVERYELDIEIVPTPDPVIDRSLDSSKFASVTGYVAPPWAELVDRMREFG